MTKVPLVEVREVSKSFGGVRAVNGVSLTVPEGGIHSLIGPNGAGKTTLFNVISGLYMPTSGDILLRGASIAGIAPYKLASLGVSRTFQNLQIFKHMTATENVMVGAHLRLNSGLLAGMLGLPSLRRADADAETEARRLLKFAGLEEFAAHTAALMPFGALKRLEIARALMARPSLLLLDEPAAGLNQSEKLRLQALIRSIADDGMTVLLVEHDMKLVMAISDHIIVLVNGTKLTEGTAAQVRAHPEVISAYLGRPVAKAGVDA
jgi:branched-chain amino acid transport system ATP-binding protein